ncbi:MAG: VOC family protein [Clostridiales bacterium]|nr:VOC family protein [Clostridiales bacterium]
MSLSFVTIGTNNLEASVEFYTKHLDFKIDKRFRVGKSSEIAVLKDESGIIEFIAGDEMKVFQGEGLMLGFEVEDIQKMYDYCNSENIKILNPPKQLNDGMKLMTVEDIHGLILEFVQFPKNDE